MAMPGYHSTATGPSRGPSYMGKQSTSTAFGKIVRWWETEKSIGVINDKGQKAYFGKKFASEAALSNTRSQLEGLQRRGDDVRLKFNKNKNGTKQYVFFKWAVADAKINWDNHYV